MSESDAIRRCGDRGPATVVSLMQDLLALGVAAGDTLIVHASLSRLGWVAGGPIAVIDALCNTVGDDGSLVMPAHTPTLIDPSHWSNPPVPESWWPTIRERLAPFDPRRTPSTHMGVIAETFRGLPGTLRSNHPVGSFAARGPRAAQIVAEHPLEEVFGEASPLGRLYELGASILLLGVGHENNTSLHLAEARSSDAWRSQGSPVLRDGKREWVTYRQRIHDSDDFPRIGEAYAAAGGTVRTGRVGIGDATLIPVKEIVDFATAWMVEKRGRSV